MSKMNTEDSTQIPAGVTLQQDASSLVITFKDNIFARFSLLGLVAFLFLSCTIYCLTGRAPITELPWVALVFVIPTYFGVGMLVNSTIFSVSETEIVIRSGPVPIFPKKRLPTDKLVGFYLRIEHTKSGHYYTLYAVSSDENTPKSMKCFGKNWALGNFFLDVFSKHFGVPSKVTKW